MKTMNLSKVHPKLKTKNKFLKPNIYNIDCPINWIYDNNNNNNIPYNDMINIPNKLIKNKCWKVQTVYCTVITGGV